MLRLRISVLLLSAMHSLIELREDSESFIQFISSFSFLSNLGELASMCLLGAAAKSPSDPQLFQHPFN